MISYLANLRLPMIILWCYFQWYVAILIFYFEPDAQVWLTSMGLSLIIGMAYNLNAISTATIKLRINRWMCFRFFLMPLCVGSFAGLVKGQGFFMIFPPKWYENALGVVLCLLFIVMVWVSKKTYREPGEI